MTDEYKDVVERLETEIREANEARVDVPFMDDALALLKRYRDAIQGYAGGTVYRKSHEDVSKELGALRRHAKQILGGSVAYSDGLGFRVEDK